MANQEKGAGMARERVATEIELTKGGASYDENTGRLEATQEQIEVMRGMENNTDLGEAALQQIGERVAAEKAEAAEAEKLETAKTQSWVVVQKAKLEELYDAANPNEHGQDVVRNVGGVELSVNMDKIGEQLLKDAKAAKEEFPEARRDRANPQAPFIKNVDQGRPAKAFGAGYYSAPQPTTLKPEPKKKGFFGGLFGGN